MTGAAVAAVMNTGPRWSGMETTGMMDAKCSLLLQEEVPYDAKIKSLPKQRVLVYQDKGFNPASHTHGTIHNGNGSSSSSEDSFYVDFRGATILQLEPGLTAQPQKTMPVTITVGGRCIFTPENYQDFRVMMRTKEQSAEMDIAPNGNFDWPDVSSLLLCPCCGRKGPIPTASDKQPHEYWMVFYPLLQITVMKGSQMTLGTRTICRLVCLDCMEDLLDGLTLKIQPGGNSRNGVTGPTKTPRLCFTLPASDVLAEAGSASFLEDGPPRPDTHPHIDDILDAWTLYNLWEHSGAWEALQNDYRIVLSRSMHAEPAEIEAATRAEQAQQNNPRLKDRMGSKCGYSGCNKVHGRPDATTGEIIRCGTKCKECLAEFYCSRACREAAQEEHRPDCALKQRDREERREKKARRVQCDTCQRKLPYTKMKKCSRCREATYCSVDCQKADWERHRFSCQR